MLLVRSEPRFSDNTLDKISLGLIIYYDIIPDKKLIEIIFAGSLGLQD